MKRNATTRKKLSSPRKRGRANVKRASRAASSRRSLARPRWKENVGFRQHRKRANHPAIRPKGPKKCQLCGSGRNVLVDHRDGIERNNSRRNLRWLCKSCNAKESYRLKRLGKGEIVNGKNPGAKNLAQYIIAAKEHARGAHDAGGKIIHETPKYRRRQFAADIARIKAHKATDFSFGQNPAEWRDIEQAVREASRLKKLAERMRSQGENDNLHQVEKQLKAAEAKLRELRAQNPGLSATERKKIGSDISALFAKLKKSSGTAAASLKQQIAQKRAILLSDLRKRGIIDPRKNPSTSEALAYRRDLAKALGYKSVTAPGLQSQLPAWVREAIAEGGDSGKSRSKSKPAAKQYSSGILGEFEKLADWRKTKRNGVKRSATRRNAVKRRRNIISAGALTAGGLLPIAAAAAASGVGSYYGTRAGRRSKNRRPSTAQMLRALHGKKRNPSQAELERAAELYAAFHGKDPEKVLEGLQRTIVREDYAGLGDLVSLQIGEGADGYQISWPKKDRPLLASDPEAKQLYIIGGDHDMSDNLKQMGVAGKKDFVDLGEVSQIEYFTYKDFDNFEPIIYYHHFGEEDAKKNSRQKPRRPRLMYDALNKRLHLVGGAYTIKRDGIIN